MKHTFSENNEVSIKGMIEETLEFSHAVKQERFYKTKVSTIRNSGKKDFIPVIISEVFTKGITKGEYVEISGELRSFNWIDQEEKRHLKIFLFVKGISAIRECGVNKNFIQIKGFICKEPNFRKTPLGRDISDLLVAVNRLYGQSDYLPCIVWGRNAIRTSDWKVGDEVIIQGRIQSRRYFKRFFPDSEDGEWREVYEISASCIINTSI